MGPFEFFLAKMDGVCSVLNKRSKAESSLKAAESEWSIIQGKGGSN